MANEKELHTFLDEEIEENARAYDKNTLKISGT